MQFNALLALQQIKPESIDVISQGFSMGPFIEDRLDVASAMIYNEYYMVLGSGLAKDDLVIIDYADYGLGFPGDVLFTSEKVKNENPDLCLRMVRASLKGWQYALENQEEAVNIVVKHDRTGVAKFDHQRKMMSQIARLVKGGSDATIGHVKEETLSKMVHLLAQHKVLDVPVAVEKIYTPEFINQVAR